MIPNEPIDENLTLLGPRAAGAPERLLGILLVMLSVQMALDGLGADMKAS